MVKSFAADQIRLFERDPEPIYFAHIYLTGETLYFSDRNFKFNGHDYEAYLLDIPETAHSIEQFGGYRNIDALLVFRNARFRGYAKLFDFFMDNPITRREIDLYVLYLADGTIPETDVSTKLHRLSFGEPSLILEDTFEFELFSILHMLDWKKLFTQISRANWPNAAPAEIGKYENRNIGSLKDVPCHCIDTGAVSTLRADALANATDIYLTEVDYPMPFPASGTVQLGIGTITYTGKDPINKKLTGCTWSIPARKQKRGEPVWEVRSAYKFLVDTAVIKSASNVKVAGVAVADTDRTITLNDNEKTTISFTQRNLLKNQGAHSHGALITEKYLPTGANFTYDSDMGAAGAAANLNDEDEATFCHIGLTGATSTWKNAHFYATFPTYAGATPDRVYACIVCDNELGFLCNEYFNIIEPETIQIGTQGYSQGKTTFRGLLTGTSVPTTLTARAHTDQGTAPDPCLLIVNVYEMWLELEFDNLPSGGENAVWEKLAPLVTCDVEGYPDDGSGTYTGTPSALIENPADFRKFMLMSLLGRTSGDIGSSFGTMRTIYNNRITPYKLAGILNKIGKTPAEIFKVIDEQTRSQMREDGGKFELDFNIGPDAAWGSDLLPSDGTGITASSWYGANYAYCSCDNNNGTEWLASGFPRWVKWDAGEGVTKIVKKMTLKPGEYSPTHYARLKDFILQGSNNDSTWTNIFSGSHGNNTNVEVFTFFNKTAYRYHRIYVLNNWSGDSYLAIVEWELMEMAAADPSPPTSLLTIDKTIYVGKAIVTTTPAAGIKNLIRAVLDLDLANGDEKRKIGDYFSQIELPDQTSITKYGELVEDIESPMVRDWVMAYDVTLWRLTQKKDIIGMAKLVCNRLVRRLERGDHFTFNDCPVTAWEGTLWSVLEIQEIPERQQFKIQAIKYIAA
jgi:hypothetical protein